MKEPAQPPYRPIFQVHCFWQEIDSNSSLDKVRKGGGEVRHRTTSYRLILQVHSFGKEVNSNSRLVGKTEWGLGYKLSWRLEWIWSKARGEERGREGEGEGGGREEGEREEERQGRERGGYGNPYASTVRIHHAYSTWIHAHATDINAVNSHVHYYDVYTYPSVDIPGMYCQSCRTWILWLVKFCQLEWSVCEYNKEL